jgi:hypothetical protein
LLSSLIILGNYSGIPPDIPGIHITGVKDDDTVSRPSPIIPEAGIGRVPAYFPKRPPPAGKQQDHIWRILL